MKNLWVAAAIAGIAFVTFFQFPGHTWVQQDTQIYAPILEHMWDPQALRQDLLVQRPHVSFTVYDETALALRRMTGLDFKTILAAEQIVTRALGVWGVYLMAGAGGSRHRPGAADRRCALARRQHRRPLGAHARIRAQSRAASPCRCCCSPLASPRTAATWARGWPAPPRFCIHPPTVYPFWGVYFLLSLWPAKPAIMRRRLYGLIPLLCATLVLLAASRHQTGVGEAQIFFNRLTPEQETLQRMRSSYVWVSSWWRTWLPHYLVLYALVLAGYWRIRAKASFDLRVFLVGLPLVGC